MEGCIQSLTDDFDILLSVKHRIIFLKCTLKHETIISKKKLVTIIAYVSSVLQKHRQTCLATMKNGRFGRFKPYLIIFITSFNQN